MLGHLFIIAIIIGCAIALAKMKFKTPRSVYDSRCRTTFYHLAARITCSNCPFELEIIERLVADLYEDLIGKADNGLVKYLCGELHARIANRRMHLKKVLSNV